MSGAKARAVRGGRDLEPTAGASALAPGRCVGFQGTKLFPLGEHIGEQSFELAARAARLWVDPRGSLELRRRANAGERSCSERGQARHRTEVR
jgi:hypothetical protein